MSVLTIAQNVAKEAGFTVPSTLVGNADEIAVQLLALITAETIDLSNGIIAGEKTQFDFNWQVLVKRGTFNFVVSQVDYNFPADYNSYIPRTMWNYTSRRPIIVPISPQDYEIQKNYLISSGIDYMVYIYGSQMHVTPTPSSTDTIYYEYLSTYIFQSSLFVGKTAITSDTDITTIPENLVKLGVKFRFLQAKGLIPSIGFEQTYEFKNYSSSAQRAMLKDGFGHRAISMSNTLSPWWLAAHTQDSNWPSS